MVCAEASWVKCCRLSVYVGGETGGTRLLPEPGADPEMQELGHVQLHATFNGAEQLEVEDGLAVLQKTRVNTGYSGHTLTSTLPAPMNELNELLRVSSCSMTALLLLLFSEQCSGSLYFIKLWTGRRQPHPCP